MFTVPAEPPTHLLAMTRRSGPVPSSECHGARACRPPMGSQLRAVTAILALAACAAACDAEGGRALRPRVAPAAGALAPDFKGRDLSGSAFRLADLAGQVVLIDFWATSCEPCRAQLPHLESLVEHEGKRGLRVVGVAMDDPEMSAEVAAFAKRFAVTFPIVIDDDGRIASVYDPGRSVPLCVLVDRGGRIVSVHEGYSAEDDRLLDVEVARALAQPGSTSR